MRRCIPVLVAALAVVSATAAARAPTSAERKQIEYSVRFFPAMSRQNAVVFTSVVVSTGDPRYAAARFVVRDATGHRLGSAAALLKRVGGWRVVEIGDAPLVCPGLSVKVRADLGTGTCKGVIRKR